MNLTLLQKIFMVSVIFISFPPALLKAGANDQSSVGSPAGGAMAPNVETQTQAQPQSQTQQTGGSQGSTYAAGAGSQPTSVGGPSTGPTGTQNSLIEGLDNIAPTPTGGEAGSITQKSGEGGDIKGVWKAPAGIEANATTKGGSAVFEPNDEPLWATATPSSGGMAAHENALGGPDTSERSTAAPLPGAGGSPTTHHPPNAVEYGLITETKMVTPPTGDDKHPGMAYDPFLKIDTIKGENREYKTVDAKTSSGAPTENVSLNFAKVEVEYKAGVQPKGPENSKAQAVDMFLKIEDKKSQARVEPIFIKIGDIPGEKSIEHKAGTGVKTGSGPAPENISLNFAKIETEYKEQAQPKGYDSKVQATTDMFMKLNNQVEGGKASEPFTILLKAEPVVHDGAPGLFLACASGKHFPKAELTVRKAGGRGEDIYFKFEAQQQPKGDDSGTSGAPTTIFLKGQADVHDGAPGLFLACASGKHIGKAELTARKAGARGEDMYFKFEALKWHFQDVLVSSRQGKPKGTASEPSPEPVTIFLKGQADVDGSAKGLFLPCASGKHFPKYQLVEKKGGEVQVESWSFGEAAQQQPKGAVSGPSSEGIPLNFQKESR